MLDAKSGDFHKPVLLSPVRKKVEGGLPTEKAQVPD
jgi:hypothetical protein